MRFRHRRLPRWTRFEIYANINRSKKRLLYAARSGENMDGLTLAASVLEAKTVIGGKIDKVYQPERDELLLNIRTSAGNARLLINVSAENGRMQLTDIKRENPIDAPMFCMLLRKHLGGGRIKSIELINFDRISKLTIEARNELGDSAEYSLVCEIMGKHSNVFLLDCDGIIIESMRRVDVCDLHNVSARIAVRGSKYATPSTQKKTDPSIAPKEAFREALTCAGRIDRRLSSQFYGLAPMMAGELVGSFAITNKTRCEELSEAERDALADALAGFYGAFTHGYGSVSVLRSVHGDVTAVYPFAAQGAEKYGRGIHYALDEYYRHRDIQEHIRRESFSIRRVILNNIERCEKKLSRLAQVETSREELEKLRLYGEMLTTYACCVKRGSESVIVDNYYDDPPSKLEIPLDPSRSSQENAARYFKKYKKAKTALEMSKVHMEEASSELNYFEGQLDNIDKCGTREEIAEIREELIALGYIGSDTKGRKKAMRKATSEPMKFEAADGTVVLIGKNNRQNDELTLRTAKPNEWWLHAKDIPGSHAIVRTESEMPRDVLAAAAAMCAYYSKARSGENVPVDYTRRKYVKKPSGARPGAVIYTNQSTIYVTPDAFSMKRIE